jgi:hypothetical protein
MATDIEKSSGDGGAQQVKLRAATRQDYEYFFGLYRSSLPKYFEQTLGWDDTF